MMGYWKTARVVVLNALISGTLCFVNLVRNAGDRAEHALHAVDLASNVTEKYVLEHGRWPSSWEELETVSFSDHYLYQWPRDSKEIQARVAIDFSFSLEAVAKLEVDDNGRF